jgi:hypothetical protein
MRARLLLTLALSCALGCQGSEPSATEPAPEAADQSASAPAAPARKSLADGTEVALTTDVGADLVKLDLATALSSGALTVDVNDPLAASTITTIIDGDTTTLARSSGINPLIITLTLTEPVQLRAARVFSTYSRFDWLLEAAPGGSRLMVRDAPDGAWSAIQLEQAQDTTVVRIEVLRVERDDFVHLNEIELYTS